MITWSIMTRIHFKVRFFPHLLYVRVNVQKLLYVIVKFRRTVPKHSQKQNIYTFRQLIIDTM